ncbi:hypothetical protein QQ045_010576 [Rhodiola kirilowii]
MATTDKVENKGKAVRIPIGERVRAPAGDIVRNPQAGAGDGSGVGVPVVGSDGHEAEKTSKAVSDTETLQAKNQNFWASKIATSRNRERGVPLEFFPQMHASDRVIIPTEIWEGATTKFRHALVGFVFGGKSFLGRVKGFARVKWGDESVITVSQLNEGIFLLNFKTEKMKLRAMSRGRGHLTIVRSS